MRPVRILSTLVFAGAVTALGGCDALATREVIVHFSPTATAADHLRVQQVCGTVPHASPLPIPSQQKLASQTDVHFLVRPGSDQNLQRLLDCLSQQQFHGVVIGYDAPDM